MNGDALLHQLFVTFIIILCGGILWGLGKYFFKKLGSAIVLVVWDGLFILCGGLLLINFLLGLVGHSFVKW